MRLGILTSHPIQYQSPWFRELVKAVDLEVFFCHRQSAAEQGKAGFGVAFEWDVDLLSGYQHRFLKNISKRPGVNHYLGCDTPEIAEIIEGKQKPENRKQKSTEASSNFSSQLSAFSFSPFDAFVVTGWHLKSYWQAVRACRRAAIPVLVRGDSQLATPRSLPKRLLMELVQRWRLRHFDGFLSVGKRNREYLEHFGVSARKIFFTPHFVDNDWFAVRAAEAWSVPSDLPSSIFHLRNSWGASAEDFVVLFVGKFQPIKRPADLLRAMAILNSQPSPFNFLAVFVGSGELEKDLRELAARENLRVHFAGFKNQSELPRYYAAADVLVLPSESETWGLVVNEAMACGLPAIVSNAVGCAPDLIEERRTGFTFPAGDLRALAERLDEFAKMKSMGHNFAPALVEKIPAYSINAAVEGTLEALIAASKRGKG